MQRIHPAETDILPLAGIFDFWRNSDVPDDDPDAASARAVATGRAARSALPAIGSPATSIISIAWFAEFWRSARRRMSTASARSSSVQRKRRLAT